MNAKRGDLVVVGYKKDYGSGMTEYELERVSSVDRSGEVLRTIRYCFGREASPEPTYRTSTSMGRPFRRYRCYWTDATWIVPAADVDVTAAWDACKDREGADYAWSPMQFRSLDDVKAFLAPFRREVVKVA
jgi:hypothetical protein